MPWKHALRSLGRAPLFTALALGILALGAGGAAALFSVIYAVLLRPLAFPEPTQLVELSSLNRKSGRPYNVSGLNLRDWRAARDTFDDIAGYADFEESVTLAGVTDQVRILAAQPEFPRLLGLAPAAGREWSGPGEALLSYETWQSRFGGRPEALGQPLRLGDRVYTIAGILPPRLGFPVGAPAAVWVAEIPWQDGAKRTGNNWQALGRLRPGVTLAQAAARMDSLARALEAHYPDELANVGIHLAPLAESLTHAYRPTLWLLGAAVGLLLLIACANIASLLVARSESRRRELTIRLALGATWRHIAAYLFAESLLLAAGGAALGVLAAFWGVAALVRLSPPGIPRLEEAAINGPVLLFALALALAVSVLFSLTAMPRRLLAERAAGARTSRLRPAIVVAEVAMAAVLLSGAALVGRSLERLLDQQTGFTQSHRLAMELSMISGDRETTVRVLDELALAARALPGVEAAALASHLPTQRPGWNGGTQFEGRPAGTSAERMRSSAGWTRVGPGYFAVMGIPLAAGRDFTDRDAPGAPESVIVNQAFAQRYYPHENPLGRRLRIGLDTGAWMTIVGVVGNVRNRSLADAPGPELYFPYAQHPGGAQQMVLIVSGRTAGLPESLRALMTRLHPETAVRFTTLGDVLAASTAAPRFRAVVLGVFAAVALLLAAAGVYGVMAYLVERRTAEIGIRMALGAAPGRVVALVARQGFALIALGLGLGLAGAAAAAVWLRSMLFEVSAHDPAAYAFVAAALALSGAAATALPAWRAARVDPAVALRRE